MDDPSIVQDAALGRPFELGMLYDCRTETLVRRPKLWDDPTLTKLKKISLPECQKTPESEVIKSDTFETKARTLGLSSRLKLSFLADMCKGVSGSGGKYLKDATLSPLQERVTLSYKYTSKCEYLDLSLRVKKKVQEPDSLESATHVVLGILYGKQDFIIFDQYPFGHSNKDSKKQESDKLPTDNKQLPDNKLPSDNTPQHDDQQQSNNKQQFGNKPQPDNKQQSDGKQQSDNKQKSDNKSQSDNELKSDDKQQSNNQQEQSDNQVQSEKESQPEDEQHSDINLQSEHKQYSNDGEQSDNQQKPDDKQQSDIMPQSGINSKSENKSHFEIKQQSENQQQFENKPHSDNKQHSDNIQQPENKPQSNDKADGKQQFKNKPSGHTPEQNNTFQCDKKPQSCDKQLSDKRSQSKNKQYFKEKQQSDNQEKSEDRLQSENQQQFENKSQSDDKKLFDNKPTSEEEQRYDIKPKFIDKHHSDNKQQSERKQLTDDKSQGHNMQMFDNNPNSEKESHSDDSPHSDNKSESDDKIQCNNKDQSSGKSKCDLKQQSYSQLDKAAHPSLSILIEKLKKCEFDLSSSEREYADSLNVTYYGDVISQTSVSTFAEALEIYKTFHDKPRDDVVPLMVWLYPLCKLDNQACRLEKEISTQLAYKIELIFEQLHWHQIKCDDLGKSLACQTFPGLHKEVSELGEAINRYRRKLKTDLTTALLRIRKGKVDESMLVSILREKENSPFREEEVSSWLQKKESEVQLLNQISLSGIPYIKSPQLKAVCTNTENVFLVHFAINRPNPSPYLTNLQAFIANSENINRPKQTVQNNEKSVIEAGKAFHNFFQANKSEVQTKFVISEDYTEATYAGGFMILYSNGRKVRDNFLPPAYPISPRVSNITMHSVTLSWQISKYGYQDTEEYEIMQTSADGSNKLIKTKNKCEIVLDNLQSGTEYKFQIRASSVVGVSMFSEATKSTFTLPTDPPGKPTICEVSGTTIKLEWAKPVKLGEGVSIDAYIILAKSNNYWHSFGSVPKDKTSAELSLSPNAPYRFTVIADCARKGKSLPGPLSEEYSFKHKGICMLNTLDVQPPSKPSKPSVTNVTHDCMTLTWEKPENEYSYIIEYEILFRQAGCSAQIKTTGNNNVRYKMSHLQPHSKYEFQVRALSLAGVSQFSDITEPIVTRSSSPPGKPIASKISAISAELDWKKPLIVGENVVIESYTIQAYTTGKIETYSTVEGNETSACVEINPNTIYRFAVIANYSEFEQSFPSPESEEFCINAGETDILKARILKHESTLITADEPLIYKLKTRDTFVHDTHHIRKCEFGNKYYGSNEKVIMVVGATGSGKTTLINGMINYILGVQWKDNYRFKLIVESAPEKKTNQAKSQTSWITSYTIHHRAGFQVDFTLTIIDTPGFGDTSGIMKDKEITENIRSFFTTPGVEGIDHIDAVAFLAQSALPRLTVTQKYIFDSILALFGKDIKENIFMLITFADGDNPAVLDALEEADLPYNEFFKFNNSALYAKKKSSDGMKFDEMFWNMGTNSFHLFVNDCLNNVESRALLLTKSVLNERHQIEVYIEGIQIDIRKGLNKLEQLKKEKQVLKEHEADIKKNKDFTYTVYEDKVVKVDIPKGKHTTTCLICNRTCHYPCQIANDDNKAKCVAMAENGNCKICSKKCAWHNHKNYRYTLQTNREKVDKTYADLKARYDDATGKKVTAAQLVKKVSDEFDQIQKNVHFNTHNVRLSIKRLDEIALKPSPLSTAEYIDILIESEKAEGKPGWHERTAQLREIRKREEYMQKLATEGNLDPFEHYQDIFLETSSTCVVDKKEWKIMKYGRKLFNFVNSQ